jgi:hypothetical protein
MLKIYPYKLGSESARDLAEALGVKRIIPGGKWQPKHNSVILNWGSSTIHFRHDKVLNRPDKVAVASNKLRALEAMRAGGVSVVDFTTAINTAREWLRSGHKVLARHKLSANSGAGISVVRRGGVIPEAPLYTKYFKKDREFRIHVFHGKVFDFQEKKKKSGIEFEDGSDNHLIRSHLNGWIFCRTGVVCPQYIKEEAIAAVEALDLDFGAVDVIDVAGRAYVLEVNTAPGLEATTLERYMGAIRGAVREEHFPGATPVQARRVNREIRPAFRRARANRW